MAKRLTTAGWLAGIWLSAHSIWGCPIPTATVAPTTVCVGAVSEVMAGYIPGDCPPVGDPWISALSLNTNGLNPPAGGTIDLPSATVTWTNTGYAWLEAESSVRYESGGLIMTNTSTSTFFFTVLKMEIVPSETNVCWKMTNIMLRLTADSFWGEPTGGSVVWTSAPAGLGGVGYNSTNFWFNPSNSTPTAYVVRAWSSLLPDYQAVCTARVWRLEIAPSNAFVCRQTNSFTFGLTNSYWGGSSVIWTSAPAGLSPAGGNGATFEINPSNSVATNYTITACIADRTNCAATGTLTVLKVELEELTFSGTKYHTVKSDDGATDYTGPHWQDPNRDGDASDGHSYPVCFTRNTKMKVSGKWHVEPANPGVTIIVKGDGPGNLDFTNTSLNISGTNGTIDNVECMNAFTNEVDFFDPMSIEWKVSYDNGSTWYNAGISTNQCYVTLGDPLTTVYHTLAHLGCKNADGENTAANCTAKIWAEFTDRDVRRVDGVQLTYYASYTCGNITTASLLANGDGQCGAWAKFFIDMRKVQGIDDTDEYVIFEPITADGFIVKNWTFTGTGSSGHSTYPYLNLPDSPLIGATSYNWKFAEDNDAAGIPGQGNANPASLFNNHQVVISGQYYDPSYGVQHANLQDIDDTIDGFYIGPGTYPVDEPTVNLDLNGDGDKTDLGVNTTVILFRKNPAGLDIQETRVNY